MTIEMATPKCPPGQCHYRATARGQDGDFITCLICGCEPPHPQPDRQPEGHPSDTATRAFINIPIYRHEVVTFGPDSGCLDGHIQVVIARYPSGVLCVEDVIGRNDLLAILPKLRGLRERASLSMYVWLLRHLGKKHGELRGSNRVTGGLQPHQLDALDTLGLVASRIKDKRR